MTDLLKRYRRIRSAIPPVFVIWTILMLALTLLPGSAIPDTKLFSFDKLGHFSMFAGWTFILGLYMIVYKERTNINLFLLMIAGILFGVFIESLQYLLPGNRSACWEDLIANALGCIMAYLLLHPVRNYLRRDY
ncbi:MAG: VanZ family protein [Balneolales bacterium]